MAPWPAFAGPLRRMLRVVAWVLAALVGVPALALAVLLVVANLGPG